MSELESAAKQPLTGMLRGESVSLDADASWALTRWAVKTAMVVETAAPESDWFFSHQDRQRFAALQALPRHLRVWLFRVRRGDRLFNIGKTHDRFTDPHKGPELAHTATLACFGVGLQVQVHRYKTPLPLHLNLDLTRYDSRWDAAAHCLWPTSQAPVSFTQLPPVEGFAALDMIARRFDRTGTGGAA